MTNFPQDTLLSPQNALVPIVVEQTAKGERSYDIIPACSKNASFF